MKSDLRIAMVGAGKMARAHLEVLRTLPDVTVCSVSSRTGSSAEALAGEFGVARSGVHSAELLNELRPDACVIAVAHLDTLRCSREAIEAGAHVLIEKPVALEPAAVRELDRDVRIRDRVAMVAMNRRFYESVTHALSLAHYYGPIESVAIVAPDPVAVRRATARYEPAVYDNWTAMNTIHLIDVVRMLCGDVELVTGMARNASPGEDPSRAAVIQFANGAVGSYIAHSGLNSSWSLILHCRDAQIELAPLESCSIRIAGKVALGSHALGGKFKPGLAGQMVAFIESIRAGRLIGNASGLEDHARSLELALTLGDLSARVAA